MAEPATEEEAQPLLSDLEEVRQLAPPTADDCRLLQVSKYMNVNIPWLMFLSSTLGWMVICFTCYSSFLFLREIYATFTPRCHVHKERSGNAAFLACNVSGICFYTFPFVCALAAVVTFSLKMYSLRLYYECLLHRIMINFHNDRLLHSTLAWFLAAYGACALCVVFFLPEQTRGANNPLFLTANSALVVYAAPLISCFMTILGEWELEWHLIPLPKFYETDPELACRVLSEATFVPEDHLQMAFEELEELLDGQQAGTFTSAEYFKLLALAARRAVGPMIPFEEAQRRLQPPEWQRQLLARMHLAKIEEFSHRCAKIQRPELLTPFHQICRGGYWVHRLLHSRHLNDERSASFRAWARLHLFISGIAFLWWSEPCFALARDFLKEQQRHP